MNIYHVLTCMLYEYMIYRLDSNCVTVPVPVMKKLIFIGGDGIAGNGDKIRCNKIIALTLARIQTKHNVINLSAMQNEIPGCVKGQPEYLNYLLPT